MTLSSTTMRNESVIKLARIVGADFVQLQDQVVIVAPADVQQVSEVLRFASTEHCVVTAWGGGTKQHWGNPVQADLRLDLFRMNSILEHAWQDMTCTVQAGTRWDDMRSALDKHGQMVALDPLWPERATVGGAVATNDSGAMRLKYGGLRDLIVGMTIVLADGTIAKTGGKVVKNVAGYDLHKLMTGSFGTLAVIAEVNFRLHPIPQSTRTWTVVSNNPSTSLTALTGLLHSVCDTRINLTSAQVRVRAGRCALDLRVDSLPAYLEECKVRLTELIGEMELVEATDEVWRERQFLFGNEGSVVLKVSVLPSEIRPMIEELHRASSQGFCIHAVVQAHGLATVALDGDGGTVVNFINDLRKSLRPRSGGVVVQKIPDALRDQIDCWGPTTDTLPLMREIKRRFDPDGLLNPGRFVGYI